MGGRGSISAIGGANQSPKWEQKYFTMHQRKVMLCEEVER